MPCPAAPEFGVIEEITGGPPAAGATDVVVRDGETWPDPRWPGWLAAGACAAAAGPAVADGGGAAT